MKKLLFMVLMSLFLFSCGEIPGTFKVIYHDNESTSGFPPVDKNEYTSGSYATVLDKNTLEKKEYEFNGWSTSSNNSGEHYSPGDKIKIKNINIFLFAVWREI